MKLARRLDHIEPFYVMECAKAAREIGAASARPMIYLNIGEPDFTAAPRVVAAAERALAAGRTQYTQATGLPELREAIARWYGARFGLDVDPARIVVTAGASAALQLLTLALVDEGDEVLMPDPSYPCNRHFVAAAGGRPVLLPSGPGQRFQLDARAVESAWTGRTRGVLLASPSNPTGTSIARDEMARIVHAVRARGGVTLVDEIYLGLSYDDAFGHSALEHGVGHGDDVIAISSFSKYFGMTGWRLGWLVLPPSLVPAVERLAQNLYICASSVAQAAALSCFEPESIAEYERRRAAFRARRDLVVPALDAMGLRVPVVPDGAFYAYADVSAHAASSWDFCFDMMRRAQVALTPGRDFGPHAGERYLRLSFASGLEQLQEALERLRAAL
ncbi:MAG TPA: pyridoxal phosphate-dependent aminotransferase [Burkholderiaceae bacterium]|nr:pyridoxal phosphate-dependent aminotransferase [Burkholderiaceae bacterium]